MRYKVMLFDTDDTYLIKKLKEKPLKILCWSLVYNMMKIIT